MTRFCQASLEGLIKCSSLIFFVFLKVTANQNVYRFVGLIALIASVLMIVSLAPNVRADAALEASNPGDGDTVPAPLSQIDLTFSGPAKLDENATRLLDGAGTDVPYAAVASEDERTWSLQPTSDLSGGPHGVIWEAKSADGHTVKGVLRFDLVELVQESATADEVAVDTAQADEVAVDTAQADEVAVDTAQADTGDTNSPVAVILGVIAALLLTAIAAIFIARQRGKAAT